MPRERENLEREMKLHRRLDPGVHIAHARHVIGRIFASQLCRLVRSA